MHERDWRLFLQISLQILSRLIRLCSNDSEQEKGSGISTKRPSLSQCQLFPSLSLVGNYYLDLDQFACVLCYHCSYCAVLRASTHPSVPGIVSGDTCCPGLRFHSQQQSRCKAAVLLPAIDSTSSILLRDEGKIVRYEQDKSSMILESLEHHCAAPCSGNLLATGNTKMNKTHAFFSSKLMLWWYGTGVMISWSWVLVKQEYRRGLNKKKGRTPWRRRLLKWESDHTNISLKMAESCLDFAMLRMSLILQFPTML